MRKSGRLGSKKPKQSLDDARVEIQEIHRDLNANVSQRYSRLQLGLIPTLWLSRWTESLCADRLQAVAEENPERSDELVNSHVRLPYARLITFSLKTFRAYLLTNTALFFSYRASRSSINPFTNCSQIFLRGRT